MRSRWRRLSGSRRHARSTATLLADPAPSAAHPLGGDDEYGLLRELCHELRTPVSSLVALSRALGADTVGLLEPQRREALRLIAGHAEHLDSLLRAAREVTEAVERGQTARARVRRSRVREVALRDLVRGATESVGLTDRTWVDIDPSAAMVRTDPVSLRRILTNLLENAGRASPGAVTVRARRVRRQLEILVADRGPGLTPADRRRLCAGASESPRAGQGLGLWIVARLTQALGGRVQAHSRTGGGVAVRLWVPA